MASDGLHALLSLPFICGASLGTVFTSASPPLGASLASAVVLPSSLTALPLRSQRKKRGENERSVR